MRLARLPFALLAAAPGLARAHGAALGWDAQPSGSLLVLLPLLAAGSLYAAGLALRGLDAAGSRRAAAFFAAVLLLAAALVWPLDAWSSLSFAAHMGQHMVLVALAPPLLLLGRPTALWLRALPPALRRGALAPRRWPLAAAARRLCASTGAMAALHGGLLWLWHLPAVFDGALRDELLHWLEHATLLASAVLFWRALLRARGAALGWGLAAMLATIIHTGMLGALLSLAPRVLYRSYQGPGALADQQLAGLIMWVPMGTVYLAAALLFAARALRGEAAPGQRA